MSIYLAAATESPARVARNLRASRGTNTEDPIRWLFLGRNYDRALAWEAGLGPGFERISYGCELQELAGKWRPVYLEWIGRMGERHASLEWWTSAIAERNTTGASLYHSICYLEIGRRWASASRSSLLIIAESHAVLGALAEHPALRARARRFRSWRTPPFFAVWLLRFAYLWTLYFIDALRAQRDARSTRQGRPVQTFPADRPRVLLHSCLDEAYFGSDGEAKDRYFPELAGLLGQHGFDVVTLPWLFNLRRSRRSAFEWFRAHGQRYLIPEDYYRFRDYVWAATVVLRQVRLPSGADEFQGLRVERLVREARWLQAANPSAARFIRYYRLIERCARRSIRVDVFIDMFENMASEKPSVMAFRRWMPRVLTVGYQHFLSIYPLLLNLFASAAEARVAPQPDVIVCGSSLGADQLTLAGFPKEKLRNGPTLKYQYLLKERGSRTPDAAAVLVMVPMDPLAAKELLRKLVAAFGDELDLAIRLRLHPMMSLDRFASCLDRKILPSHFTIVGGTMDECLAWTGCAVVMSGSTAFEVVLNAVPVVVVGRDTDFDFNPLAWFPEFPAPTSDPTEIRSRVRQGLRLTLSCRRELEAWATRTVKRAVSPMTEDGILAFVAPLSRETGRN